MKLGTKSQNSTSMDSYVDETKNSGSKVTLEETNIISEIKDLISGEAFNPTITFSSIHAPLVLTQEFR